MRAELTVIAEIGEDLPEVMKLYNCKSLVDGREYTIKVRKITKLSWIDGMLAIDIKGDIIET